MKWASLSALLPVSTSCECLVCIVRVRATRRTALYYIPASNPTAVTPSAIPLYWIYLLYIYKVGQRAVYLPNDKQLAPASSSTSVPIRTSNYRLSKLALWHVGASPVVAEPLLAGGDSNQLSWDELPPHLNSKLGLSWGTADSRLCAGDGWPEST